MRRSIWVIALITGCTQESGAAAPEIMRIDSVGMEIVTTRGTDFPRDLEFQRIASSTGESTEEAGFFQVRRPGLAVAPSGELVVMDQGNQRVVVLTEDGQFARRFGREGQGPGEFQFPSAVSVDVEGVVSVFDLHRSAEIRFDLSGELIDEEPLPPGFGGTEMRRQGNGFVYPVTRIQDGIWELRRASDAEVESLWETGLTQRTPVLYESCGISMTLTPLFAYPPRWDATEDRIAVTTGEEYSVEVMRLGEARRVVRRDMEKVPATERDAEKHLGEGERWTIGVTERCTVPVGEVLEQRGLASYLPLISAVAWRPGGELWVRRFEVGVENGPIDTFDPEGEYLGTLPEGKPWPGVFVSEGRMWVIEDDEMGVEQVALYEITDPNA